MEQVLHGVWLVDKPRGITSHDVVARARKLLKTRQIGHAGTLDPMATGLLILLIGEATKLSPFLTLERKRYRTEIRLGIGTDSLDADGTILQEQPLPSSLLEALAEGNSSPWISQAIEKERLRTTQIPPAISAIHVKGERAYQRVRRGEDVQIDPRSVQVFSLEIISTQTHPTPSLCVNLDVSKGYYVRSLARDLGDTWGVPAHLTSLRRLQSGAFHIEEASSLEEPITLLSLKEAAQRVLPTAMLSEQGATKARQGKTLHLKDFEGNPASSMAAWFQQDQLIAIGEPREDGYRVVRGFCM